MSTVVYSNYVIPFSPALAKAIGTNESLFLQQLHYWIGKSKNSKLGRKWVFNSAHKWQQQLSHVNVKTIERAIKKLKGLGIIKTANFNKNKYNQTLWYTIDYAMLKAVTKLELYTPKTKEVKKIKARTEIKKPVRMPVDKLSESKTETTKNLNTNTTYKTEDKPKLLKTKDVVSLQSSIQEVIKADFYWTSVAKLLRDKGQEVINKYLDNWDKFKTITKKNIAGYFYEAVMGEYSIPKMEVAELQHSNCSLLKQYENEDLDQFIFKPKQMLA